MSIWVHEAPSLQGVERWLRQAPCIGQEHAEEAREHIYQSRQTDMRRVGLGQAVTQWTEWVTLTDTVLAPVGAGGRITVGGPM